jgi:hypothetical protein
VAAVFPLRGGLLVLFSIQLPYLKFIRPGGSLRRGSPTKEVSPATRPDTFEDDGDDYDVCGVKDGTSSDRCSSGSGTVWVFCLASGGLSGVIGTPFERKVFLRDASGLPLAPPWGLAASGPCVGAAGGLRFPLS